MTNGFIYVTMSVIVKLKRLRKKRGLSLRKLAEMSGVHYVSIIRLESGNYDPRLSTLRKLAKALHVTVAELIGETTSQKGGKRHGTHKT